MTTQARRADAKGGPAQTVRRALAVLRLVATGQEHGVRLADLAAMSGLARPTVHRLLQVLVDESAVEQDPLTRRYLIGPELFLLGLARASRFPIRSIAEPYLRALADEVGDTVFLSVRHGADSVCIARCLGHHTIQVLSIDVGARRPLGASVSGVILLAGLAPEQAREMVALNEVRLARQGLQPEELLQRVEQARAQGHVYAPQGVMPGTRAVAVPVRSPPGEVLAAISVAALADRLERRRIPDVVARMQQHAAQITRRIGEIEAARATRQHARPRAGTQGV